MNKNFAVFIVIALTACGLDKPPSSQAVLEPASEPVAPTDVAVSASEKSRGGEVDHLKRFSEDLVANHGGHFRFDRLRETEGGGQERQVFIEMVGVTDKQAATVAALKLEELGYEAGHSFGDENGLRMNYQLEGQSPIRVLVRSREAHSKLENEAATSSVYVTHPVTP